MLLILNPFPNPYPFIFGPIVLGKRKKDRKDDVTGYRANTWLPSESRSVNDQRAAVEQRDKERAIRDGVLDGSRAPKLTGRNRYNHGKGSTGGGTGAGGADPAALAAVRFCLSLFSSSLRYVRFNCVIPVLTPSWLIFFTSTLFLIYT
jgi:hypothetical protein